MIAAIASSVRLPWRLATVVASLSILLVSSCNRQPVAPAAASRPLSILISCDTAGWIVPCGCSTKQAGGLLRRATLATSVRKESDLLLLDAGGAPGGKSEYDLLKFEAVLAGEVAMEVAAHNIGTAEAELGPERLRSIAAKTRAPLISTNLLDRDDRPIADAYRLVTAGSTRFAVLGVLSPGLARGGLEVRDPHEAVLATLKTLAGRYDQAIVLAYLPEEELSALVTRLPEADIVVGGPTGQSIAPRRTGPTVWGAATNKGKFLVRLDRPKTDVLWEGTIVELDETIADDPEQTKNLGRFRDELARVDFSPAQTSFARVFTANTPAEFRVVGTAACQACHEQDCDTWKESGHARAWRTLVDRRSHVDPYCQQCHTTGYGLPGGFASFQKTVDRANVGCESCHGPGHAHAERPERVKTLWAARDRCTACHDHENSPEFRYESYWPRILHGEAEVAARPAGSIPLPRPDSTGPRSPEGVR